MTGLINYSANSGFSLDFDLVLKHAGVKQDLLDTSESLTDSTEYNGPN